MENLLQELEAISPKEPPSTAKGFDFTDSSSKKEHGRRSSEDISVTTSPPIETEENIPKIRNIYDELHPLPNDPPPKKPPRAQGSSPNTKQAANITQNGGENGQVKATESVTANVSELDALLKTLGDNVHKTAGIVQGIYHV